MKLVRLILCISALTCLPPASATEQRVTLGSVLFPPNTQFDEATGECIGENIDVTRAILASYEVQLDVVCALPIRMYRMIQNSEVDFTVNIKTTRALKPYVEFIDPPYDQLVLNLYKYSSSSQTKTISAIRGFDYNGYRQKYMDQNYEFIDLPTAVSAIQVFLKQRSDALISYQSNVVYLQRNNAMVFPKEVIITPLIKVDTHYAIARGSPHFDLLWGVFNDYASKNNLTYFSASSLVDK